MRITRSNQPYKHRTTVVAAVALVGLAAGPALAATANRVNGPCTKLGASTTIKGKSYICTNVLGKKLWTLPPEPTTTVAVAAATTLPTAKADSWDDVIAKAKTEGKV